MPPTPCEVGLCCGYAFRTVPLTATDTSEGNPGDLIVKQLCGSATKTELNTGGQQYKFKCNTEYASKLVATSLTFIASLFVLW